MGYSVRTSRYRYTEWAWVRVSRTTGTVTPRWTDLEAAELYDYETDPDGTENRADDPELSSVRETLSSMLKEHFV
jgi:hypothetical protein